MRFTLEIDLGNEAMRTGDDIATALYELASTVHAMQAEDSGKLRDLNGNTVGEWSIITD